MRFEGPEIVMDVLVVKSLGYEVINIPDDVHTPRSLSLGLTVVFVPPQDLQV